MTNHFTDIALILSLTAILAAIFARFRQPLILSHLLVGVVAASSGILGGLANGDALNFLAELGVAFALFLIGLELSFSDIRQIGKTSITIGIGQVLFTSIGGILLAKLLGFSFSDAFFLGLALTFSSTIIVVKLLGEKRDLDSLYGKIATGFLIVQDFVAIIALILIVSLSQGEDALGVGGSLLKGLFLIAIILILNKYFLQKLFDLLAKNSEVLFLSAVAWALIFSSTASYLGFSLEIGAFLAGLGLSKLREERQIAAWIRPLRDLFIIIFFLTLGLKLTFSSLFLVIVPVVLLSLFVLVINPAIVMGLMGFLGFRVRTSFHVGVASAQISEFSLIMILLAYKLRLVGETIVQITTGVALITIVLSTYLILHSSKIYRWLSSYLTFFQRSPLLEVAIKSEQEFSDHVVLVGAGRLGWNVMKGLIQSGETVLVVEFDPLIIKKLGSENIPAIYGDISDPEIFERAGVAKAKMIISTVFDYSDTEELLEEMKKITRKIPIVVTSAESEKALEFYKQGASYVIVPRILSSHLIEKFIVGNKSADLIDGSLRKQHMEELASIDR